MDDNIREAFDKTDHDADYYYAFKSGYASRNQEVEELKAQAKRMKENSKCIHKCKHCDSMIESIYKYCPWCGERKS